MDLAQEVENRLLARQKPMNDVIDRGDSPVQLFYKDTTVFITGASGFIGKQLLEKLFRSCDIKKVYLLMRAKKGNTTQQRLAALLSDSVYDVLRQKKPQFADRISVVEGDVAEVRLGLSDEDWSMLTEEVNIIFHVAATVNFDEPLKIATLINVRGTREALQLGKECKNIKCFNHCSTAFAHATKNRIDDDVEEKFYQTAIPPDVMIRLVESVDEDRLNAVTASILGEWPNTYTFTKSVAEELIRTVGGEFPICIVKPPVVTSSYVEPKPGWIDPYTIFRSTMGYLLGSGLGLMHVLLVDRNLLACYAPVDYVNNALIAASWDAVERRKAGELDIAIYTISSSGCNTLWKYFGDYMRGDDCSKLQSPKCVWYAYTIETSSDFLYWVLTWLLHYIPGYLIDGMLDLFKARPKGLPRLSKVYRKLYALTLIYKYFSFNTWHFKDHNLRAMIDRMSAEDRAIYNCDITTIDFQELMDAWIVGLRRDHVKDGLQGSDYGYKKQKYFLKYANIVFLAVYGYLIYFVCYMIYAVSSSVVRFVLN